MNREEYERHIISIEADILEALNKLNSLSGGEMTLAVIDDKGVMKGTLTDGDIRRGLIRGIRMEDNVGKVMQNNFQALTGEADDIVRLRKIRNMNISLIPSLDSEGKIEDFVDTTINFSRLPLSAVLMAGGKGERLRPMTLNTPKPLLKIRDKSIIDYNIDLLRLYGIKDISVTVNYMAEKMEEHFEGSGVRIVNEEKPLGTIGALSLIPHTSQGNTLVMNADILTTLSIEDMYIRHIEEKADITIATIPYNLSVPYAILSINGSKVTAIEEKPSYSFCANAGIYIFSNEILDQIPSDKRIDATDFIEEAISEGKKVTFFPITGTWIDIGSPSDFKYATQLMEHLNNMNRLPL